MKLFETSQPKGRRGLRRRAGLFSVATLTLLLGGCGDRHLSTMDPESPIAERLDTTLVWLLYACLIVFVAVMGVTLYMAYRFRVPGPDDDNDTDVYADEEFPEQTHGNTRLEIGWTIAPTVIMAIVAFFTLGLLFDLDDVSANDNRQIQSVTVVGQQWWWEFQYDLDGDGEPDIVTANELVLPLDEEIQLHVTSRDVIHSFWVPALNGKRDAVPGRYSPWTIETFSEGRFPGECTEFCGLSHAYMEKFAIGLPLDEWQVWAANQAQDAEMPAEGTEAFAGLQVFNNQCASCHVINGLTSHNEDGSLDTWALYSTVRDNDESVEDRFDRLPARIIDKQTQVSGAAPNLTHFASRSSFAGGIFDLYENFDEVDSYQDLSYLELADKGDLNRGALEAWITNAPEQKANAWDSPAGGRGMTPFTTLSAEDVDNLVAFLMSLD